MNKNSTKGDIAIVLAKGHHYFGRTDFLLSYPSTCSDGIDDSTIAPFDKGDRSVAEAKSFRNAGDLVHFVHELRNVDTG